MRQQSPSSSRSKASSSALDEFLVRLFEQDYPRFRAIFAIESTDDPATAILSRCCALAPDRVTLVLAGEAIGQGQKTNNLLAAVSQLRHDDEILVFADADILPEPDWLSRLVEPLVRRTADIVTGLPWPVVKNGQIASLMLASIAAMAATLPRLPFLSGAWGGSTAIRLEDFRTLGMDRQWRGALSDDLQLTNVAVRAGLRIAAPADVLLRTAVPDVGFAGAIARMRRWYMLARLHIPVVYGAILAVMTFAALGWLLVSPRRAAAAGRRADRVAAGAGACRVTNPGAPKACGATVGPAVGWPKTGCCLRPTGRCRRSRS